MPDMTMIGNYAITVTLEDLDAGLAETSTMEFEIKDPSAEEDLSPTGQASQTSDASEDTYQSGIVFTTEFDVSSLTLDEKEELEEELTIGISKITKRGLVTLHFSHQMIIPDNFNELLDDYLAGDTNYKSSGLRQLGDVDSESLLKIDYASGNPTKQNFAWQVVDYRDQQLAL